MCEKRVSTTQHAANNMQNTAQLPQQLFAHFLLVTPIIFSYYDYHMHGKISQT